MNKAAYIYNAMGQRTRKVTPDAENGSTTIYHYDLNGLLIIIGVRVELIS